MEAFFTCLLCLLMEHQDMPHVLVDLLCLLQRQHYDGAMALSS